MPKVSDDYIREKKNKILDAALKVSMSKPMYEVSMRDIISESGLSQGGIYRYFSNIDDVLINLINRENIKYDIDRDLHSIFTANFEPEKVVLQLFLVWKKIVLDNMIGVGKIYYEICAMYVNDKERLYNFLTKCSLSTESGYLEEKSFNYITEKIKEGYFSPKIQTEDIFNFIATSFDGITRDLILFKVYNYADMMGGSIDMDSEKLVRNLALALILLLGGNEKLMS